jgi:uncharacterized membrane protein
MFEYSHMGGFGFGMLLFWIFVIAVFIWFLRSVLPSKGSQVPMEIKPLELLKKRLASGEIDEAEYQRLRQLLEQD